jgi:hypothetical protein
MSWSAYQNFVTDDQILVLTVQSQEDSGVVVAVTVDLCDPADEGEVTAYQDGELVGNYWRGYPDMPCVGEALFNLADSVLAWMKTGGVLVQSKAVA